MQAFRTSRASMVLARVRKALRASATGQNLIAGKRPSARRVQRPCIQSLEGRRLLSTVVVTTIVDTSPHAGFISLRDAVTTANSTPNTTITFSPTVFNTAKTIVLNGSPLILNGTGMVIKGPTVGVTISANNLTGVFANLLTTASYSISNLTITKGNHGGLLNSGTGTLTNVTVTGNSNATGNG